MRDIITPCGCYRYKTLPQGFITASDSYTNHYDEVVTDIPNQTKCIYIIGMWEANIKNAFFQACHWMDRCSRHGITQNPAKFHFTKDVLEFMGFEITMTSIRPSNTYIWAI
jgi:hypothetical protein